MDPLTAPQGTSLRAAVHHATLEVPTAAPGQTIGEVREALIGTEFETAREIVILDGRAAIGLVSVESLLAGRPDRPVTEIMRGDPPIVTFETDEELAAHAMVDAGVGCLVVAGPDGEFLGLILADQMLAVLLAEHDQDLARIGGYMSGSRQARGAAHEAIGRRLWHRLPWLLIGLLGAMGTAVVMAAFEEQLEANVLIALFVPAIVYMADAVGTQTETLLIRALAVGVSARAIVFRELLTGAVIGTVIGMIFFAFAAIGWGDVDVALAVGVALIASSTIATGVAMALPTVFQRFGIDPAFGSGPLATVVQDLLSILVYFAVVVVIVT